MRWSLYDLWRKWERFCRYETAHFVGGPLDGVSYPIARDAEEWIIGSHRYVRWRPVFGSLVASYWRFEA